MKLDYISNINSDGDNVVRLYDFDRLEAEKFRDMVQSVVVTNATTLELKTLDFIEARNCNLTLRISDEETGITRTGKNSFCCDLTIDGYSHMLSLLDPFCKKETKAYQWLYDIDNPIDFLFSPAGTW